MLLLLACKPTLPAGDTHVDSGEQRPAYSSPADCTTTVEPGSVEGLDRWPYLQSGSTDGMTVVWGGSTDVGAAELRFSRDGEETVVAASSWDIEGRDGPLRLFQARATGLPAGTDYCYAVTLDGVVMADGLRFRTAPSRTDATVRFLVIGDFGAGTEEQILVRDRMFSHSEGVDLILTTGDNAYSSGTYAEFDEHVFDVYRDLLHGAVLFPTPGNHDYSTDDAEPYLQNHVLPETAWRSEDAERYYDVPWGPLHFVALDSEGPILEISSDDDDDMVDWLHEVLATSDRPWRVPAYHKPAVEGHATRGPDVFTLGLLVPEFEEHQLELVLQGHNHHYERFEPLVESATTVQEGGTTYVVTGGGGRSLYDLGDEDRRAVGIEEHHFLLGEVDGCSLTIESISKLGEQLDLFTLERC